MVNNGEIVIAQSIFKIGSVLSVNGREVKIKVDKQKNLPHTIYNGSLIKNVSVGGYVKIINGFSVFIAKVEGEYIQYDNSNLQNQYSSAEDQVYRVLSVSLLGYMTPEKFVRGVKQLPLINNDCYILSNSEFEKIHCFVGSKDEKTICIGTLASDTYTPISLGIQKLFSSHIGIFGNTGSGKSYTLAKLYRELFKTYSGSDKFYANSRFLFIDFNGEYSGENVIVANKQIYNLSTKTKRDRIPFNKDLLLDLDTLCIFANATEKTQRPFIKRCIDYEKHIESEDHFKNTLRQDIQAILCMADKPKGELLIDYIRQILQTGDDDDKKDANDNPQENKVIEEVELHSDFNFHDQNHYYYKTGYDKAYEGRFTDHLDLIKDTVIYKYVDNYTYPQNFITKFIHIMYLRLIRDILDNRAMNEHIAPAINKLRSMVSNISKLIDFSVNEESTIWNNKNIVIVNLNDVNLDSKKMIPLLLCNKLYDEHTKEKDPSYLNIIIDEAHNILSYQSTRESDTWKDYRLEVFEKIIKEGRKFGVFMTIASQRPSDISTTIVSQLHNYFIHRLVNDEDIDKVGKTISYLDRVSQESLPILSTGVCVVTGQMVEMPILVQINKIEEEHKPLNETIDIVSKWS